MSGGRFEVYGHDGSRWLIDSVHESLAAAMTRCEDLSEDFRAGFETLKVLDQNKFANRAATVHEQTCLRGAPKPVKIQPVTEVSHCERLIDYYAVHARLVLCRLLRGFLDDERITALELMHDYTRLRRLLRDDRLYPMALSHVATLQAKNVGMPTHKRSTEIDQAVERIVNRAKNAHAYAEMAEVIATQGLDAAYGRLPAEHGQNRKQVELAGAMARHMRAAQDWPDKLAALLDLLPGATRPETFAVIDEAVAEILESREAVDAVIGVIPELGDRLIARVKLARGTWHEGVPDADARIGATGEADVPEIGLRLSRAFASGRWSHAPGVLMRQVGKALHGTQALRRQRREERESFNDLLKALHSVGGLAGGPEMADAVTRRARLVHGDEHENLAPKPAVVAVMKRLRPRSAQIGYLLALAASPFGVKYRSVMIETLTEALKGLKNRQGLLAEGAAASDPKTMMRELYAHLAALENNAPATDI